MSKEIEELLSGLEFRENGIYYAGSDSEISYPEEGNAKCFEFEDSSFWFKHRNQILGSVIKEFVPEGPFFDIGGGNGFVAKHIETLGIPTALVEPGEQGAINARTRGLEFVVCSTLKEIGLPHNSLKAAGAFDVIEHIKNDNGMVQELFDVVEPGGYLFVTVPAYPILWSGNDMHAGHFRRYTLQSFSSLAKGVGFDIAYRSYFFSPLPPAIFLKRTIPTILKLKGQASEGKKERRGKQHKPKKGVVGKIAGKVFQWELDQVRRLQKIPFGSSCLIVCRKPLL